MTCILFWLNYFCSFRLFQLMSWVFHMSNWTHALGFQLCFQMQSASAVLFVWWNIQQLKTQKCFSETANHSHELHCQLRLHFNNRWTHINKDGMLFMSEFIMWESGQSKVLFQRPDHEEWAAFSTFSLIDNKRLHNRLCFKDFQILYNISQLFLHD